MKTTIFSLLIAIYLPLNTPAVASEALEFEVHGMTCAFCVDALRRKLEALPEVEQAEVSLRHRKVRIILNEHPVDYSRLRQAVIDAGFSPVGLAEAP